ARGEQSERRLLPASPGKAPDRLIALPARRADRDVPRARPRWLALPVPQAPLAPRRLGLEPRRIVRQTIVTGGLLESVIGPFGRDIIGVVQVRPHLRRSPARPGLLDRALVCVHLHGLTDGRFISGPGRSIVGAPGDRQ